MSIAVVSIHNTTHLIRPLKKEVHSSLKAGGSFMQCKSDAESSYRSFLYHFYTALSSHLSERPLNVRILLVRSRLVLLYHLSKIDIYTADTPYIERFT